MEQGQQESIHASQVRVFSIWFSLQDLINFSETQEETETALQHLTQNPTVTIKTQNYNNII